MQEEKNFEKLVKKYLSSIGAYFIKTWGNLFSRSGVADILCCYKGRFIAIELKAPSGRVAPLQLYHKRLVEKAGGISIILYPKQFDEFKDFLEKLAPAGDRVFNTDLEGIRVYEREKL